MHKAKIVRPVLLFSAMVATAFIADASRDRLDLCRWKESQGHVRNALLSMDALDSYHRGLMNMDLARNNSVSDANIAKIFDFSDDVQGRTNSQGVSIDPRTSAQRNMPQRPPSQDPFSGVGIVTNQSGSNKKKNPNATVFSDSSEGLYSTGSSDSSSDGPQ